jgi:hypothetical protein
MAIRLLIESEEPHVEDLLTHLDSRYEYNVSQWIYVLERTLLWLRVADPKPFTALCAKPQLFLGEGDLALGIPTLPRVQFLSPEATENPSLVS